MRSPNTMGRRTIDLGSDGLLRGTRKVGPDEPESPSELLLVEQRVDLALERREGRRAGGDDLWRAVRLREEKRRRGGERPPGRGHVGRREDALRLLGVCVLCELAQVQPV